MDITKNIFYWFRGPSSDGAAARQLENNLTKSLLSVLEHCDRTVVLRAFLKAMGLRSSRNVVFSLQRKPTIADTTSTRIVLGISGGAPEMIASGASDSDGRPDAWLCGPNWTILVESKIGPKLRESQLAAHARAAGWEPGSYRFKTTSWHALHRLLRATEPQLAAADGVSRFLLKEWLAYLEHQNMTEFEKLETIDFDFLNLPEEQCRPLLPTMKKRLRGFARLLSKTAPAKRIAAMYDQPSVERWKYGDVSADARGGWFNVGGDPSAHRWHLTVFIRPEGVAVTVLNSLTHLTRRLCRSGDVFRRIVTMARRSPDVCVSCRRAWYANPNSPYKGQHIVRTDDPLVVKPGALDEGDMAVCAVMLERTIQRLLTGRKWRTEFQVRREIPRRELLAASANKQVEIIAGSLEVLADIMACLMATEKDAK